MSLTTAPSFVRAFGPGATGPDVLAVKRALAKAGDDGLGENLKTPDFGAAAQTDLIAFKRQHKLAGAATPTYDLPTHRALSPFFDLYGASLLAQEAVILAHQQGRSQIVAVYRWMIAHHDLFDYDQFRPIPVSLPREETSTRIKTDCSGSVTLAAKWAGVPDPNGLNFNGEGNTGTMLAHCEQIMATRARPGDLIWYGANLDDRYGHHIVLILEGEGPANFVVGSHGHQTDPEETTAANEEERQVALGQNVVRYLTWLP